MDGQTLQQTIAHIKANEGINNNDTTIYKDTNGNLTAGSGINVNTKDQFASQPFREVGSGRELQDYEKRQIFQAFRDQESTTKTPAEKYMPFKNLTLSESDNNQAVIKHIQDNETRIRNALGTDDQGNSNYDKLTDGQKTMLSDVAYANNDSLAKFPKLIEAAKNGDAKGMADQSTFHGGHNPDGSLIYNWPRLVRNRQMAEGISEEDARKEVANQFPTHPHLPDYLKKYVPSPQSNDGTRNNLPPPPTNKSSDAGNGDAGDTQTAMAADDPDDTQDSAQTASSSDTAYGGSTDGLTDSLVAQNPGPNPPDPTTPLPMAKPPADIDPQSVVSLLGNANDTASDQDNSGVPGYLQPGGDLTGYASDITGSSDPTYFAPMSVALNQMSDDSSGGLSNDMSDDTSLSLA